MMANIIWNTMNSMKSPSTPLSPMKSNPPSMLPTSVPKAIVNPTTDHTTLTMPMVMKFFMSMLSTFFDRTMPP